MAWQPGTPLIFLYSDGEKGGGYTFMLNADTGQVCELDFGGWVVSLQGARWSTDGRYLAIKRATNFNETDLTLLNTLTGEITTLGGMPEGMEGKFYVYDFIWAPDNLHLLAIGEIYTPTDNQSETGLYLVDSLSGQSIHIVPENKKFVFSNENNFAWSLDGSKIAIHCPSQTVDQICLIAVQRVNR